MENEHSTCLPHLKILFMLKFYITRLYTNPYGPIKNTQVFYIKFFFIYFSLMVIISSDFNQSLDYFFLLDYSTVSGKWSSLFQLLNPYLFNGIWFVRYMAISECSAWIYNYSNLINQPFSHWFKGIRYESKICFNIKKSPKDRSGSSNVFSCIITTSRSNGYYYINEFG